MEPALGPRDRTLKNSEGRLSPFTLTLKDKIIHMSDVRTATRRAADPCDFDIAVIGAGLVGAAIAYGLAKRGQKVVLLDEGDRARRASVANFSLIWVQTKGQGMPEYSAWSRGASALWPGFHDELRDITGIDLSLSIPGGFHLCLSDAELESRVTSLRRLNEQPDFDPLPYEIMDHDRVRSMLPDIGPDVVGASYCPLDGQCNSLRLFWGMHSGFQKCGGVYRADSRVERLDPAGDGSFRIQSATGLISVGKVVIAAGNDSRRLAPMVGLVGAVRPQRGQVLVTERMKPFLHYPTISVRQADEGGCMLGDAIEEGDPSMVIGPDIASLMAERAMRMFPGLAHVNIVRTWAAQRVMTKDGCPVYDQSQEVPGAFIANCHSGVTLAPRHAETLAAMIVASSVSKEIPVFSARRFDV